MRILPRFLAHRGWTTDERGSMPFAVLVATVVLVVSSAVSSSIMWQIKSVATTQSEQDAAWAADNAVNIAMERLATVEPSMLAGVDPPGFRTTVAPNLNPPSGLGYLAMDGATGQTLRWWLQKSSRPEQITLFAQGRGGLSNQTANHTVAVTLIYDYDRATWIPQTLTDTTKNVPVT